MSEGTEDAKAGKFFWWQTILVLLTFSALWRLLQLWMGKPLAATLAAVSVFLTAYLLIPGPKIEFIKWLALSLLMGVIVALLALHLFEG